MPNETKYHPGQSLGDKHYFDDYRKGAVFESLGDDPIFSDGIPVLTDRLSAIELQIARSTNKGDAIVTCTRNDKKGLLGGFWLRRRNKELA